MNKFIDPYGLIHSEPIPSHEDNGINNFAENLFLDRELNGPSATDYVEVLRAIKSVMNANGVFLQRPLAYSDPASHDILTAVVSLCVSTDLKNSLKNISLIKQLIYAFYVGAPSESLSLFRPDNFCFYMGMKYIFLRPLVFLTMCWRLISTSMTKRGDTEKGHNQILTSGYRLTYLIVEGCSKKSMIIRIMGKWCYKIMEYKYGKKWRSWMTSEFFWKYVDVHPNVQIAKARDERG